MIKNIYTLTLNFVKKEFIDIFKTYQFTDQAIFDDKNNSKRSPHILEGNASGVQVGDIHQVSVCILL